MLTMKNIIFYSISFFLIGLMLCHDEAHAKSLSILTPDEIENMFDTSFDDDFGSDEILSPFSNNFKTIFYGSWNKIINILNKIFDNFLVDNTINESVTNTAKRSIRDVDNMTNVSLAQSNITTVRQNLNTSTESVLPNKVAENQTQPHIINYSLITNSTPSADYLSATFINIGPLINNDTKQNNNTRVNNNFNILYSLSTWSGFIAIKKHMNLVSIIVSSALLLLLLGIMQFVTYRAHRFRNLRREINQEREFLL